MSEIITSEQVKIKTAIPEEKLKINVLDAAKHCLEPINSLCGQRREGTVALVGGGPSLAQTIHDLGTYKDIIICGSAHDYVVENWFHHVHEADTNVYCLICDPDPIMCEYLQLKCPEVTYLIASQCDKTMFAHLADMPHKHLWHAASGDDFDKEVFGEGAKLITGGCTVGTRAIGMAMAMGWKRMDLFGFDSCLSSQYKHHAYDFVDPEEESLGEIRDIRLGGENGKRFIVASYMLAQIFDFQNILRSYADKLDIGVVGGGALAYLLDLAYQEVLKRKENGTLIRSNGAGSSPSISA